RDGHVTGVQTCALPILKLKSFSQEPFRLVFASRTEDTFGINTIDLRQPTQFVKIGDTIVGTHFRVAKFTEKTAKDRYGTDIDVRSEERRVGKEGRCKWG